MTVLVVGAGMMGSAVAYDLARFDRIEKVILADIDEAHARSVASSLGQHVEVRKLDVNSYADVVALMKTVDAAVGATSYTHNVLLTEAAIEAGVHFCDLGGNMDVVYEQMSLDARAKAADVLAVPNCGLAPGLACIVAAEGAKRFSRVDEIHLRVGGLPQHPQPPFNYQLTFSPEGLINEYIEPAEVIRNGETQRVESMTDLEELEFPQPFGKLEAFNTSGGVSTLTKMFTGKVQALDYKTIRYPGHCEKFKTLLDLGFASSEPVTVGNSVRTVREIFEELLRKKFPVNQPDAVLMRVTISGILDNSQKTLAYDMIDLYDEKTRMTAMARTTSFPTSIIAQMIVDGRISARGVLPPEQCVPLEPLIEELKKRNIVIRESIS